MEALERCLEQLRLVHSPLGREVEVEVVVVDCLDFVVLELHGELVLQLPFRGEKVGSVSVVELLEVLRDDLDVLDLRPVGEVVPHESVAFDFEDFSSAKQRQLGDVVAAFGELLHSGAEKYGDQEQLVDLVVVAQLEGVEPEGKEGREGELVEKDVRVLEPEALVSVGRRGVQDDLSNSVKLDRLTRFVDSVVGQDLALLVDSLLPLLLQLFVNVNHVEVLSY